MALARPESDPSNVTREAWTSSTPAKTKPSAPGLHEIVSSRVLQVGAPHAARWRVSRPMRRAAPTYTLARGESGPRRRVGRLGAAGSVRVRLGRCTVSRRWRSGKLFGVRGPAFGTWAKRRREPGAHRGQRPTSSCCRRERRGVLLPVRVVAQRPGRATLASHAQRARRARCARRHRPLRPARVGPPRL